MMTAVDILMPVYNGAEHLDRALASLSAQTFRDMRVIISDNASTDATPQIIEKWKAKDTRITSFRQPENIGAVPNFKWVLSRAQSPFAMFACHDDIWSDNYIGALHEVLSADPDIKLAAPKMTLIRPDGSEDPRDFYMPINKARGLHRALLSVLRVQSGWFYGLYRRESLVATWDTAQRFEYAWGGDYIGLLPLLVAGEVAGSSEAVYYKLETPLSAARYKPKTLAEQRVFYRLFLHESLHILKDADISSLHKLALMPAIALYAGRHGWKLRRLVKDTIKNAFDFSYGRK